MSAMISASRAALACHFPMFPYPTSTSYCSSISLSQNKKRRNLSSVATCSSSKKLETPLAVEDSDGNTNKVDANMQSGEIEDNPDEGTQTKVSGSGPAIEKDLKKVVTKTAATFAPRASTATKNPAVPGSALYTVFEVQGYASMLIGGVLSFNLLFPSNEPDLWRLMGMWSIWMFTIPSLRARDCSNKEKEALNYLFLLVPLINVIIPFFWKSFAVVWSADTIAFFAMYAWKLGWLQKTD